MTPRRLSAGALAAALETQNPPVLLDIRDPVEAERGHIAGATSLPRRRLEFRIGELVRDPATSIAVYGGADARAELAATTLARLGYQAVGWLVGGIDGWRGAGGSLASGNNVPSKKFGERVHHRDHVPSIDADTLRRWQQEGRRLAVCDVRTPEEHRSACIPGAVSAPSFDIAQHAFDLAAAHDTVIVHCAGRTRSIIGAQTLVELGLGNVFALENGTMGWRLAGHALEQGSARTVGPASADSSGRAEQAAARLAAAAGVGRLEPAALEALLAEPTRNRCVLDVRSLAEHLAGHIAGAIALPGGQAVQRADDFIAVRAAPIVLIDAHETRANLTATWLRRMGFPDVSVLAGGVGAWRASGRSLVPGRERGAPLGWQAASRATPSLSVDEARRWLAEGREARVLDVDGSVHFRRGHVPGAQWVPRGWLEARVGAMAPSNDRPILVTCADGAQSAYAAATLQALGHLDVWRLAGGTRAWAAAGHPLEPAVLAPQDDELRPAYEKGEQAMRDYIDWEKLLVPEARPAAAPPTPEPGRPA
jgi:rhodanese-related sulfurtransferase